MSVKERLKEFLKAEGISASEFSRKMELSPAYLASMRKSMPEEKVERLIRIFPQLNRDWLLYGEGSMYKEFNDPTIKAHRLDRRMIPMVPTEARAGSFDMYAQGVTLEDCTMIYTPYDGAQLAIQVSGDSMEPEIHDGTVLFLEKINSKAFIPWGSPLVIDSENGSLVKMLYPSEKGEDFVEARSYNKNYPPFQIPTESIFGIYRIVGEMRRSRTF